MPSEHLTLLIVNYLSADLTKRAIASARAATSQDVDVVVVDNSCDDTELGMLADCGADRLIVNPTNRGFAGGINAGLALCKSDNLLIANPDVVFRPDSVDRLMAGLREGVGLVGPKLTWDPGDQWLLPPADLAGRFGKFSEALATQSPVSAALRIRWRARRRIRFWRDASTRPVKAVSGAVMMTKREIVRGLGGFDERFPLYFEEIDFMRRVRRAGMTISYSPDAICRHLYNQSAGKHELSAQLYAASELAYHRKWSGRRFVDLLGRLPGRTWSSIQPPELAEPIFRLPDGLSLDHVVVEASPLESFETAAGHFPLTAAVAIPPEILQSFHGAALYVRAIDSRNGRVLKSARWTLRER